MSGEPASFSSIASFEAFADLSESLRGVHRAAASDAPILIVGEAGSGRSTLARAIHLASPRAAERLVEFDAIGVPESLFEAELFGVEAGAFTGAERALEGRVALAEQGSLVLDRVDQIPLTLQGKLLRLLAERVYAPLGGRDSTADVRFLAIGSEDLAERAERGAFRTDLLFRLDVLRFRLPPLRERRGDLFRIAEGMLVDLAARLVRAPLPISSPSREWMLDYSWPGNLRELRNRLERAFVMARKDGPLEVVKPAVSAEANPRPRSLARVEEEEIRRALAYTRGHQGHAADILGISRKALWEKRKRLGIP